MAKPTPKLFVIEDTSLAENNKVLVAAGTRGQALETAIGSRFKVNVADAMETAELVSNGVKIMQYVEPVAGNAQGAAGTVQASGVTA